MRITIALDGAGVRPASVVVAFSGVGTVDAVRCRSNRHGIGRPAVVETRDAAPEEEDAMMTRTRRTFVVGAFILLAVLGTAWALERATSHAPARDGAVIEPAKSPANWNDLGTTGRPVIAPDQTPEYDRSDLILSQG
jgi:hypothetical protein